MATDKNQAQAALYEHHVSLSSSSTSATKTEVSPTGACHALQAGSEHVTIAGGCPHSQARTLIEKTLVRKLDLCVMPILVLMCAFTVIDKAGVR